MIAPCMCGARDCPDCNPRGWRCEACSRSEECPHGYDVRACREEEAEDRAERMMKERMER